MKKAKLLEAIRNNPANVRFNDFCKALEAVGFMLDRQRGSHRVYKHPRLMGTMVIQPRSDGHAKPYQVRQFLAVVERHNLELEVMEP